MMNIDSKIYVAGHNGLAGSAIYRKLSSLGYKNIIIRTHKELDLENQQDVITFFKKNKPDYVFIAPAKVGGIHANSTYKAEFIYNNLMIQSNVINASYKNNVKRLVFLGSTCIYPRLCKQPMNEDDLLSGPLEPTNESYAIAKIAGVKMIEAYNKQYNTNYLALMPTNMFGPNDNYDLKTSHVLPALIRKIHEAKIMNNKEVVIWGSGSPRREFLFVDDFAKACIFLFNLKKNSFRELIKMSWGPIVNIGYGKDFKIIDIAKIIKDIIGFKGNFIFDKTKPDGTKRKLLDSSVLNELNWKPETDIKEAIEITYKDFLNKLEKRV